MAEVSWTPQAIDDLEAICLFISRDSPQYAAIFADRAFVSTDRLVEHPRSGRVVPEIDSEDIREIILGSYRLIYRICDNQVQMITVHHGARQFDPKKFGIKDE